MACIRFGYQITAKLAASTALLVFPAIAYAQETRVPSPYLRAAQRPDVQNVPVITNPPAGAVILRAEPTDITIQSLDIRRQLPLANIRSQPIVTVGTTKLDFKPMLNNPRALFNIATSLRKLPKFAEVMAEKTLATEVDQGIIVNSTLTYRLKRGACNDGGRRAMIAKAGVSCATQLSDAALATAFANPNDAHFVADPAKRATALAEAKSKRATSVLQIAADITELRGSLNDPTKRAQIDASVGASESTRLAGLSDEQLTMELVNSAESTVDQTIFIPRNETPNARLSTSKFSPRNGNTAASPMVPLVLSSTPSAQPVQNTIRNLDTRIFLTGFTLGREYEWREGVSTSIKWCVVGCKKTYYAEAFARIGLGFGLRFPIQISGLYKHHLENGKETATLTANYEPINGTADDYAMAGLPTAQQFSGKEIVAEAIAEAGVRFKIPYYGEGGTPPLKIGDDYTTGLPEPFANGQFKPPAPGELGFPALTKTFEDQDMLLGVANWGVIGAKVFPQVKFELHSTSLRFKFRDLLNDKTTVLESTAQTVPLTIDADDHSSRFALSDPDYTLGFLVTPGLVGRLFIDLAVWSHNWDYDVWFPQVAVALPPGGAKFACHAGTSCSRTYNFSPTSQSETVGPASPNAETISQWKLGFEKKWKPQCPDQQCKKDIYASILSIANFVGIAQLKLMDDEFAAAKDFQGSVSETLQLIKPYEDKIQQNWQNAENYAAEALEKAKIRASKQGHSTPTVTFTEIIKYPAPAASPPILQRRTAIPDLPASPTAPTRRAAEPAPTPPPVTQGRTRIPNLVFPPAVTPRGAPAVMKSTLCSFNSGPRAGQVQDYAPMAPIPVGSNCQDARGSFGTVVAQ